MEPLIKICGITNTEDALFAAKLDVWALGFVFAPSPRRVSPDEVKKIIEKLPPYIARVGIFVNETPENIKKIADSCKLDIVQLHGEESPRICKDIKKIIKVIKAFRVKANDSLNKIRDYEVDLCLLDACSDKSYGGTGEKFDWELARNAKKYCKNIILSGGLDPENIIEAIETVQPYAVDVSSGVEISPGKKDKLLVEDFVSKIKNQRAK
ncbi:MAG: phosphoribosylanthranilate isomerase [Candidatus Omnitrophica bacterium CG07_land_8_20_14_0_80_42_15]|uniref:N-(5'-phosphoribosyl)anthranilate isomerase n=1 Tax=Candidatus Aquitaenariimonas noxiae TaxID=1974741 RepID=A0A2J0L2I7_9BACT|nr:MAG: phosphoribosylanthranilate isomerase [Candidatus Omnitrophica bacterium CG07_land_8_20_14_0_80_42_15]